MAPRALRPRGARIDDGGQRRTRDRDMPDASPIVRQEHQDPQEAVGRGRDHEEFGPHDPADMIAQEGEPGPRWGPVRLALELRDNTPPIAHVATRPKNAAKRIFTDREWRLTPETDVAAGPHAAHGDPQRERRESWRTN
jgi:hypothetical protein